jgi:hypothetical protein
LRLKVLGAKKLVTAKNAKIAKKKPLAHSS